MPRTITPKRGRPKGSAHKPEVITKIEAPFEDLYEVTVENGRQITTYGVPPSAFAGLLESLEKTARFEDYYLQQWTRGLRASGVVKAVVPEEKAPGRPKGSGSKPDRILAVKSMRDRGFAVDVITGTGNPIRWRVPTASLDAVLRDLEKGAQYQSRYLRAWVDGFRAGGAAA